MKKQEKGITLIALIITIVVLLILAVVAINSVKDGGIISHAQKAASDYKISQEKEKIQLALNEWAIQKKYGSQSETLQSFIAKELSDVATVTGEDTVVVTFNETGNQYLLNENWEQVSTVTDLERYIFGQDLVGRPYTDILSLVDPNSYAFTFLNDEITPINEEDKVIYSDTGAVIVNNQVLLSIYFKYEDEFYKFAVNMDSGNTDVNYGLIKLPKVDTSNYTVLEKYMFGEHGQGRCVMFTYNLDDRMFIDHPTIPDASTKLIPITSTQEGVIYFKYEDEIYKVLANQTTYNIDPNYGVVKIDKLEEGTEVGKIVEYDGAKWTILYDDSINGLQMIRNTDVGTRYLEDLIYNYNSDEVKIADLNNNGFIDTNWIEEDLYAYNTAIELLNKACENKVSKNENIIEVRCVGSNPVSKNSENSKRYISEKLKEWPINNATFPTGIFNGRVKDTDLNYISDYERMLLLGINNSHSVGYWLASRVVVDGGEDIRFKIRVLRKYYDYFNDVGGVDEVLVNDSIAGSQGSGSSAGLRPVVKLKPDVLFSGSGTETDPYTF